MYILTLESVLNQNLTCRPLSSSCSKPMTLDTLKTGLKPPCTANIAKSPLLHTDKNGSIPVGRTCIMVVRMGSKSVEKICMENIWTHATPASLAVPIRTHKEPIQVDACSLKLIGSSCFKFFPLPGAH